MIMSGIITVTRFMSSLGIKDSLGEMNLALIHLYAVNKKATVKLWV